MTDATSSFSSKFTRIYNSLPIEGQRSLLESQLLALLDNVSDEDAQKVLQASSETQAQYSHIPNLDLKGKQREISGLLEELAHDSKISFASLKDRSKQSELMRETVESLLNWLSDVWITVYEYHANFQLAHECLLYIVQTLTQLSSPRAGGCKCAFVNLHISMTIRNSKGDRVKSFQYNGGHHINDIILWLWRELLVSMLECQGNTGKFAAAEIVEDIQDNMGSAALERLLYGGNNGPARDWSPYGTVDEEDDDFSADAEQCPCNHHAAHWSSSINEARLPLRDIVASHLTEIFAVAPSLALWTTVHSVASDDQAAVSRSLFAKLKLIAPSSSDTISGALDIYSEYESNADIISLLTLHGHMLNPGVKTASALQNAARSLIMSSPHHHVFGLKILEAELLKVALRTRAGVTSSFSSLIHSSTATEALATDVLSLRYSRSANSERSDAVEHWVETFAASASQDDGPNPMTHPILMAAALMGMPVPIGLTDDQSDDDGLGYLDVDDHPSTGHGSHTNADPDLDDLIEEFRPRLRDRWEGWMDIATSAKGGPGVLVKVYNRIIGTAMMPYLRATDVVDEMISRLTEKPSKSYLCDALETLSTFCKQQRKKEASRKEKKRRADAMGSRTAKTGSAKATIPSTATRPAATIPSGSRITPDFDLDADLDDMPALIDIEGGMPPLVPIYGGLEDVD